MGQNCLEASFNIFRMDFQDRYVVEPSRLIVDSNGCNMDQSMDELDLENGKAALREVQAELTSAAQHLLVIPLSVALRSSS